jgi:hypothetical protein
MPDSPPDRLSNNPRNPFFKEDVLKRDIGVRFNGIEKTNVEEYCVSEGWIRVEVGKTKDRYGNPMTIRLNGKVEPYFKDTKPAEKVEPPKIAPKSDKSEEPRAEAPKVAPTSGKSEKSAKAEPSKTRAKPEPAAKPKPTAKAKAKKEAKPAKKKKK